MTRDILFLLQPRFLSEDGTRQCCPDTMLVEGILACFPDLRSRLDIRYVDFPKPRQPIVDVVGTEKQGAPMLVRSGKSGQVVLDDVKDILRVLVDDYGVSQPRGMI